MSRNNREKNKNKHIAEMYLKCLGSQKLHPLASNMSILGTANEWNTKRFFGAHYRDKMPFPAIVLLSRKGSISSLGGEKLKVIAEEVFEDYWKNPRTLSGRISEFMKLEKQLCNLYSAMSYKHVKKVPEKKLCEEVLLMNDLVWHTNAMMMFCVIFDKKFCDEMLLRLKITDIKLERIWDRAIVPLADSFERRMQKHFLEMLKEDTPWEEIVEQCQYFKTGYPKIFPLEDIEVELKAIPQKTPTQARDALKKIADEKSRQLKKHNQWLSTLSKEEQKLANYIQQLIEFRDRRKDLISRGLTAIYRAGQRLFERAKIPEELVMYVTAKELGKGLSFLIKNKKDIIRRADGYGVFISYEGEEYAEYRSFDENKKILEKAYLEQEKTKNTNELIGQTGSPGKATGKVKLIMNIVADAKQFNKGDILVSGATRPEFVALMRKAGAVVTDEGGITCHAGIISRELGIPCIIGTKIATRVLHDGDLVEVNANHGIVRILEKKR